MPQNDDCMQSIYDHAEALMDTLDMAENLIRAADHLLSGARKQAAEIARATMAPSTDQPD